MRKLIYVSPVPWISFAQRPQKFVLWFRQRFSGIVLWVEPYPTRLPKLKDLFGAQARNDQHAGEAIPSWLMVTKPLVLPIEPLPGSSLVNQRLWRDLMRDVIQFSRSGDCTVVVGKPSKFAVQLLGATNNCRRVYDAMDDFSSFYSGVSRLSMRRTELAVASKASEIWTSSTPLHTKWSDRHTKVHNVFNGLDPDLFEVEKISQASSRKMVFGYVGTVAKWFDWEMVNKLARFAPDAVVRIIGPMYTSPPPMLSPNIEILPPCDHSQALRHMAEFDVGLIPFLKTELTSGVDPIKYYEYRALGLPVLSSSFGEMAFRRRQTDTYLVDNDRDLVTTLQVLRTLRKKPFDTAYASENSWASRFEAIF